MEDAKKIELGKDTSRRVTNMDYPGQTIAELSLIKESTLEPRPAGEYPKLKVIIAEDEKKWKEGIATLVFYDDNFEETHNLGTRYLFNIDCFIWIARQKYAKAINDLEVRALRRERMIKIYGKVRMFFEKILAYFRK